MNEQLMLFENEEVKVRTDQGETLINLANTARVCGVTKVANSGNEIIKWKNGTKGVFGKLEKIRASLGCTEVHEQKCIEEIDYILNEIEETDDRNSIFMSRYLTSRFAMECYSTKANEYKSWLAQLDEKYSKGELQVTNQQVAQLISTTVQGIVPIMVTEITKQFAPMLADSKKQVDTVIELLHDQATIYDEERNELKNLIGFRSVNTTKIINGIKDKLSDKYGYRVTANSSIYQKIKKDIFKEFDVIKWEDISVSDYHKVFAFADEYISDLKAM